MNSWIKTFIVGYYYKCFDEKGKEIGQYILPNSRASAADLTMIMKAVPGTMSLSDSCTEVKKRYRITEDDLKKLEEV